jgi:hypothetical protein
MQSVGARHKIRKKVQTSPDEATKVGETLFLVLDRFIDLDKPELLAKVFLAYVDDVVSAAELQRLAQAIDLAFSEDLKQLISGREQVVLGSPIDGEGDNWKALLVTSGLTTTTTRGIGPVTITYAVTPLGQALWRAFQHVEKRP